MPKLAGKADTMTRSILAALAAAVSVTVISGTGCNATGVGDPCIPEAEYSQAFLGFNAKEVNVESKSFQCQTRLCLANHFQGRVTCPYGQSKDGTAFSPATTCGDKSTSCCTPIGQNVNGVDPTTGTAPSGGIAVQPQCTNRTADKAVYCSCRCADVDGNQPAGQVFCECPTGFSCTQLVSSIGATDSGLTGAYCVRKGTEYDSAAGCPLCDPTTGNCGHAQGI
jgi:hypothetical protein